MNIGIIDCGGANLNSIYYSFKRLGINAIISNSLNELSEMNAYVLPGVGSADVVMNTLRKRDLINFIKCTNKPILGICIGMQILFDYSEENQTRCLGIIDGNIEKFNVNDGVGVAMAKAAGYKIALISGRYSPATEYRAKELNIEDVYNGGLNKITAYEELKRKYNLIDSEIAYVGDDLIDISVMEKVGAPIAVANAINNVKKNYPERFGVFVNLDLSKIGRKDFKFNTEKYLLNASNIGATGLKIYKNLGLNLKDGKGKRVKVDDDRLQFIWEKCAELNLPVLIHSGEPIAFFQNIDRKFRSSFWILGNNKSRNRRVLFYIHHIVLLLNSINCIIRNPEN